MSRVLITGANRGIGLELVKQFYARTDEVIAVCRKKSPELAALPVRIIEGIDVADPRSLEHLHAELQSLSVDLLINNAGILSEETLENLDLQKILKQFEVNTLGPLQTTKALLSHLHSGAKVVMITSRMGSIGDNSSGNYYGYRISKTALNMASVNLAHDLKPRGIGVFVIHPGMVATEMTDKQGIAPAEAAKMVIQRIDALGLEQAGMFWHANGEKLPW